MSETCHQKRLPSNWPLCPLGIHISFVTKWIPSFTVFCLKARLRELTILLSGALATFVACIGTWCVPHSFRFITDSSHIHTFMPFHPTFHPTFHPIPSIFHSSLSSCLTAGAFLFGSLKNFARHKVVSTSSCEQSLRYVVKSSSPLLCTRCLPSRGQVKGKPRKGWIRSLGYSVL